MPERKWRMTRLGPGDYLLPSNDEADMYRIWKYDDGRACGLMDGPKWITRWAVSVLPMTRLRQEIADKMLCTPENMWNLDWQEIAANFHTRREAIDFAVNREQVASR